MTWTPSHRGAKRAAGILLKAHRSGEIALFTLVEAACVDMLLSKWSSHQLRRSVGKAWLEHGPALVRGRQPIAEDPSAAEIVAALSA